MAKTFNNLFESMNQAIAMKTLGLGSRFTEDDLKAAYRKAAKDNHPDRGGSTEKMQAINSAYDFLKASVSNGSTYSFHDMKTKREEEKRVIINFVTHMFDKFFDVDAYLAYFTEMSGGKKFKYERKIVSSFTASFVTVQYRFESEDASVFFDIDASSHVFIRKALGSGIDKPELEKMGITTSVLINRSKVKMTQSNYNQTETEKFMKDPKVLFPTAKLKKAFGGGAKAKKLKRADYVLTIQKELGGRNIGQDYFEVELNDGFKLFMSRMVFMRKGYWDFSARGPNKERIAITSMIPESSDPENLDMMIDAVMKIKNKKGLTERFIVDTLQKASVEIKDMLTKKGLW